MDLAHYLEAWDLCAPEILASTATSTLYKVTLEGGPTPSHRASAALAHGATGAPSQCATAAVAHTGNFAALRIATPAGLKDEWAGIWALEYFAGEGSVRLLQRSHEAQLLEYISGPNLLSLPDEEATLVLAETLRKLHSPKGKIPASLIPLEQRFASLLQYKGENALLQEARSIAQDLLAHPQEECVLHGDLHHENMLLHPERGWLAIDPKGLYGERTFDACNLLFNPVSEPELVKNSARLERTLKLIGEKLGLEKHRYISFALAYGGLSACWSSEEGQDFSLPLYVMTRLRSLLYRR